MSIGKQLTVKELISLLKEQPQDALVWHGGCDCWGKANGVKYFKEDEVAYFDEGAFVLIGRSN